MNIDNNLRQLLENETKIHLAEIRFLYQKLDRQLGLNGAGRYGKCFLPASVFLLYSDESDENTYLFCREILFHKRLADEWKQSPYFG